MLKKFKRNDEYNSSIILQKGFRQKSYLSWCGLVDPPTVSHGTKLNKVDLESL